MNPTTAGCPVHPGFDPLGEEFLRDPYAILSEVGEAPVFYAPSLDYYVVMRYADIERVFLDPETFSAANAQLPLIQLPPEVGKTLLDGGHKPQPSMVSLDGRADRCCQQELQDRRGANDLNAFRVLRPTKRVANRRGLVRTRGGDQRIRNFLKQRRRNPANLFDHFRRVAPEVTAQGLEGTARMLQGQIAFRKTQAAIALVTPGLLVVGALLLVPAREKAGGTLFRIAKIFAQNAGCIREVHDVIAKEKIVLDNVPRRARPETQCHPRRESAPRCRPTHWCAKILDQHE